MPGTIIILFLARHSGEQESMRRIKLDKIDRQILRDLQRDGRMTNVELASRAGISAPPCLRRERALEESGYIRGYHADVHPAALGSGVTVFATVGPARQADRKGCGQGRRGAGGGG